ncbi:MAG TPA: winged helix-turn-helix transcriptional regulator [Candidatus Poseidoniales archaeon]|nr:winged helix-turn-helix transcriptional regulator [Candidatus Poseidoniales archaeon]
MPKAADGDKSVRRNTLLSLIQSDPGVTTAEIVRNSGLSRGVVRHHLRTLVESEQIVILQNGRQQHHFITGSLTSDDQSNLALLRQGTVRRALLLMALEPGIDFPSLLEKLDVAASTLSEICTRLTRLGLINRESRGRMTYFHVREPQMLHRLLTRIEASLLDRLVDRFLATWQ